MKEALFRVFSMLVLATLLIVLSSCVTVIPIEDYTLARAAIDSARESDAPHFAPALWYKAEASYKEAQKLFKERFYSDAHAKFIESRFYAERAENEARIKAFESGEGVPK